MLPYGSLWKLDKMIHDKTAPKRKLLNPKEHRRQQRRQTIAYAVMAMMVITFFMLPYYLVHMRLLIRRLEMEKKGMLRPVNEALESEQFKQAVQRIRAKRQHPSSEGVPEWAEWMSFRPAQPLAHVEIPWSTVAGKVWPVVGLNGSTAYLLPNNASEHSLPAPSVFDSSQKFCIAVTSPAPLSEQMAITNESGVVGALADLSGSEWLPVAQVLLYIAAAPTSPLWPCEKSLQSAPHEHIVCLCSTGLFGKPPYVTLQRRAEATSGESCWNICSRRN